MDIGFLHGFKRIIRLKDLEAWDIKYNNKYCRIILVDEHRPSTQEDFPWLNDGIDNDPRKNHITSYVFFSEELDEAEQNVIYQVTERFSDHLALAHCNVTVIFEKVDDFDVALNRLLHSIGYKDIDNIPLSRFFYLSQD